jgi:hypothetical protein
LPDGLPFPAGLIEAAAPAVEEAPVVEAPAEEVVEEVVQEAVAEAPAEAPAEEKGGE